MFYADIYDAFPVTGARCRFASTADSQCPCIFPCRCTQGCDTATGDCLNGGRCEDDHPNDYQWSGTACQTGGWKDKRKYTCSLVHMYFNIHADVFFSTFYHSHGTISTARRYRTIMVATRACPLLVSGNVGFGKTAWQSPGRDEYWSSKYPARLALDGNIDPDLNHNSCAHPTAPSGTNAWWMVDLGDKYRIDRVIIYNRKRGSVELFHMPILVVVYIGMG